jgi:antitoxin HicB
MEEVTYIVHVDPVPEGGFIAYFPDLPGCHTQGETLEEVFFMAKDVLDGYLASLQAHGQSFPQPLSKQVGFDIPVSASLAR